MPAMLLINGVMLLKSHPDSAALLMANIVTGSASIYVAFFSLVNAQRRKKQNADSSNGEQKS